MKNESNQSLQFALCLDNDGYPASLEVGKVYRVIPDDEATALLDGCVSKRLAAIGDP